MKLILSKIKTYFGKLDKLLLFMWICGVYPIHAL